MALPDTIVSIRAHPAAEPFALTMSTEGGQFTLHGVSPGQHELRFEHPRFKTRAIKVTVCPSVESMDAGESPLKTSLPQRSNRRSAVTVDFHISP